MAYASSTYTMAWITAVMLTSSILVERTAAIINYAHSGPFGICDQYLRWKVIPALPFGKIVNPDFPSSTTQANNCQLSIQVERDSWIGIYTDDFMVQPAGSCIGQNELIISGEQKGPIKHFCGLQRGLLYSKYLSSPNSYLHLNYINFGSSVQGSSAIFELSYIGAKAIYRSNGTTTNRAEASNIGHVVSHDAFTEQIGSHYPANVNSKLTLTGLSPQTIIELDFLFFELYQHRAALCKDYVEIIGVIHQLAQNNVIKICNKKSFANDRFKRITTVSDKITFHFRTGPAEGIGRGFIFRYTVVSEQPSGTVPYHNNPVSSRRWKTAANHTVNNAKIPTVKLPNRRKPTNVLRTSTYPTKPGYARKTSTNISKKNKVKSAADRDMIGQVQWITTGATFLIIVVIIVVVIAVVVKKRRESREEMCYADNNLFSVGRVPRYNMSSQIGWDRNSTISSVTDENIYYNDVEIFQRHCDLIDNSGISDNGSNIYHVIEERVHCTHESTADRSGTTGHDVCRSAEDKVEESNSSLGSLTQAKKETGMEQETNDSNNVT